MYETPFKDMRKRSGSFQNEISLPSSQDLSDHTRVFVFKLGICAMECKVSSSPMQSILKRLARSPDFEIVQFPEVVILNEPIAKWPVVDCLIAFHSTGYPFEKVQEYVNMVEPVILNDLEGMRCLRSRLHVLQMLKKNNVPIPSHMVVDHPLCALGRPDHIFEEHYDYIVYNGLRLNKPFIEKPLDADDHNNYVYYPRNTGGGCKKLFRKIKDRSSLFYPDYHQVRRDGIYVYEEFLATFGTDVKVYTVGPFFAHAEARKAPTLDGKVLRTPHGKEVRYPVILTENEKVMAYKIVEIFKQVICGFDILRTTSGSSYICDVNGWSFVKGNVKYYNDCAHIMRILFLTKLQKKYNFIPRELREGELSIEAEEDTLRKTFIEVDDSVIHPNQADEELRAMIVVMRHGDRQPKQKLKFETSEPEILEYHKNLDHTLLRESWATSEQPKQVKLKSPEELQGLLKKTRAIIKRLANLVKEDALQRDLFEQFSLLQRVLERGDGFAGINRKLQIKPVSWTVTTQDSGEIMFKVERQLIVAKWGGELTSVGRAQAEDLGRRLRAAMYPGDAKGGLLRLHSTFRHDLKIYTSDEGRCQVTSAAFTKGFLDLEGQLTPILVQMVVRNAKAHSLLDSPPTGTNQRDLCKKLLDQLFNSECGVEGMSSEQKTWILNATGYNVAAPFLIRPKDTMMTILTLIQKLVDALSYEIQQFETATGPQSDFLNCFHRDLSVSHDPVIGQTNSLHPLSSTRCFSSHLRNISLDQTQPSINPSCSSESTFCDSCRLIFLLSDRLRDIRYRWEQLKNSWYRAQEQRFDSSKLPDLVDNLRYDLIHNHTYIGTAALQVAFSIYTYVEPLVHFVSPAEYGLTPQQKIEIGMTLIPKLLKKIIADITFSREAHSQPTDLGWTSRSINHKPQDTCRVTWSPQCSIDAPSSRTSSKCHDSVSQDPTLTTADEVFSVDRSPNSSSFNQTVVINTDSLWGHQRPPNNTAQGSLLNTVTSEQLKHSLAETNYTSLNTYSPSTCSPQCKNPENAGSRENGIEKPLPQYHDPISEYSHKPNVTEYTKDIDLEVKSEGRTLLDDDEHDDTQSHFRLKEKEAIEMGIKSPWRIVRSRYYVASASHIFSLFNILLYGSKILKDTAPQEKAQGSLIDEDAIETAYGVTDIHYLSHIVLRVWEKRVKDSQDAGRFRLEIQFSTGAKDGFGGNYQLLRKHAQGKQAVFQKHLEHLFMHHSQAKRSLDDESQKHELSYLHSSYRGTLEPELKAYDYHSAQVTKGKETMEDDDLSCEELDVKKEEELLRYASEFGKAYASQSNLNGECSASFVTMDSNNVQIPDVPPYCEINPLHRLTRNCLVERLEKMVFSLLNQAKVQRQNFL